MGYRTVALSRDASKKDFATKLGATDYVDGSKEDTAEALNKMGGADLIVLYNRLPHILARVILRPSRQAELTSQDCLASLGPERLLQIQASLQGLDSMLEKLDDLQKMEVLTTIVLFSILAQAVN